MTDRELFQARFIELLRERNKGIPEVSRKTGISRLTLYNYRAGRRSPVLGDPHRQQIADALDANVGWLNGLDIERDKEATDGRHEDRGD